MKKFMVLYLAPVTASAQIAQATPEQAKAGMDAWNNWAKKAGSAIVDLGMPLGNGSELHGDKPATPSKGKVGGFSIMQANSAADLQKALKGHPHFMIPGASIEVWEYLQLPGSQD
jgi:hypothetical protein